MRNLILLIDAGYLYSAGSDMLSGKVQPRERLELRDPQTLLSGLKEAVQDLWDGEPLRLLRTYWYDGARDGLPSASQIQIGDLPRVKLRLGRVSGGGQKGVDGLIILDLITIAQNKAADVILLMSGDEDLRETVLHAQGYGVSVVLAGFPATARQRQSVLLMREADHTLSVTREHVSASLKILEPTSATLPIETAPEDSSQISAPPQAESDAQLDAICRSVVQDDRFRGQLTEERNGQVRLVSRADRVLVARIAEATGVFPVDSALLQRARTRCVELAGEG